MIARIETILLRLIETICIALLVTLAVAVIYSTTMRYVGASPVWYDEVASVLLAWLTYFGASYAIFTRAHMSFGGIVAALPRHLSVALAVFSELLIVGYFALVAWYGASILKIAAFDSLLSLPWVTLDIVQSVIPISAVLMIVGTLLTMPRAIRDAAAGVDREHAEIEHAIAEAEKEADALARKEGRS